MHQNVSPRVTRPWPSIRCIRRPQVTINFKASEYAMSDLQTSTQNSEVDSRISGTRTSRTIRSRPKIAQVVAAEIVSDIVSAGLVEGDQLSTEATMVRDFDVGRASVREGLRLLEAFGLISIRQGSNGGPIITGVRPEDVGRSLSLYFHISGATFGDLISARLVIEPVMARLAAERQNPGFIEALRNAIEDEQAASLQDPEYLLKASNFHHVVSGMSGNGVLDLVGRALRSLYQDRIAYGATPSGGCRPQTRIRHAEIGQSILNGDGARAAALMTTDLSQAAKAHQKLTPGLTDELIEWTTKGF